MEYEIASGTIIAAYGYYVLTEDYNFDTTRRTIRAAWSPSA